MFNDISADLGAKFQSRIGTLLLQREKLLQIKNNSKLLTTRTEAENLLTFQSNLEGQIADVKVSADKLSTSGISIGIATQLAIFYKNIDDHIKNVDKVYKKYQKELGIDIPLEVSSFSLSTISSAIGILGVAWWFFSKKKRR